MDKIIMQGMQFFGRHGVLPEEKTLGQKFIVDMEIYYPLWEPCHIDDLCSTVDYSAVYAMVNDIVEGESTNLVEALAERIADAVLEKFPIHKIMVRVKKPQAPMPGIFEFVAVEITRERHKEYSSEANKE